VIVVAKIGTSSITNEQGTIAKGAIEKLCAEIALIKAAGNQVVVVTSGAIAAGLPSLGLGGDRRPRDSRTLQAVSAIGQSQLMRVYDDVLHNVGLIGAQVLLAPLDFMVRQQYLHARSTLTRLLELGVVPVINENDAIADDEIRFGDNDRLAALVAHLVKAETLVLLTDAPGLLSADPRSDPNATLIEEVHEITPELEQIAGGAGTVRGSGGMASKLAAAKIASASGVRTVIANANRSDVLSDAMAATPGVGTIVHPKTSHLSARKLWIAFAGGVAGRIQVDAGARRALETSQSSLLPAGVVAVSGEFQLDDIVEISDNNGRVFARGLAGVSSAVAAAAMGLHTGELPEEVAHEVIHRDNLVILP